MADDPDDMLLVAVGRVLKEQLDLVHKRIDALDESAILHSILADHLGSTLTAIRERAEALTLHRAKVISRGGALPDVIEEALE